MWTLDVPKEPGFYWFFGWIWGKDTKSPKFETVNVNAFGMLVAHGAFVDNIPLGWFCRMPLAPTATIAMADWLLKEDPSLIYQDPRDRG